MIFMRYYDKFDFEFFVWKVFYDQIIAYFP